ncbi:hypothetical protein O7626_21605 [Micromonospora sp. WMMD1102]|uniref:hypothetical protein n=1 Tax=Micromonospora sp. WMMD1102 TaxID=3016105 RepID=UPI0024151FB4|nr:hypothetical protein [Micromonospora sp. WMMD1102]MDG4788500.1 hypothetical protein [Micromonospora sp. WMMD1102]
MTTAQLVVTVAAAGAAVLWSIGLVLLQPLSEPAVGSLGENNTYWARELRWDAIVAIVLAVVVCAHAQRRVTGPALLGGLAWLAVDIGLDRAELSHGTIPLAIAAAAVAVAGCYQGIACRGTPSRAGLLVVAAVAAVLSGVGMLTESPTDTEPALNPGSAAASGTLALIAIGAALSAAPRLSQARYVIGAVAVAIAATAPWLLRNGYPQPTSARLLVAFAFTGLLTLSVVAVAWRRPDTPRQWLRYPAVTATALLVFPLVLMPAVIALMIVGVCGFFTALAGNPPINSADSDVVIAIPGILTGLVLGSLLVLGEPGRGGDGRPHRRQ